MSYSETHNWPFSREEYRIILREDLVSFVHAVFSELHPETEFVWGPHLDLIAERLQACREGKINRLIVSISPRYLKSLMVSVAFVAFLLGHNPALRIICSSYGQDLTDKLARDMRKVINAPWYRWCFPRMRVGERSAIHDFETTLYGGRLSASVGGPITGRGADFIIIDDPLKPEEAFSETQRGAVNAWIANTLLSRLNDREKGCIILVMQRLHQDDLAGHLLEQGGWEYLALPAIATEDTRYRIKTPLGERIWHRKPDEPLHPARESLETLIKNRNRVGEYIFQSQYQQSPTPIGGYLVKREWLKYYEPGSEPARFDHIVQSWDTANKSGELNDFSVCTTWGVKGNFCYLLHVYRKRINFPELKKAVADLAARYRPHRILIEDKASGTQLIQELHHVGRITAYSPPPGTDKQMRLYAQTAAFESGQVILPKEAYWLNDYVNELTGFPGTRHDDQVDSTTQFLDHKRSRRSLIVTDEVLENIRRRTARSRFSF